MKSNFKYYIEIVDFEQEEELYALQSQWFDTEEEAREWAKGFDFMQRRFRIFIMTCEFINDEEYDILASEDILQVIREEKREKEF